jgi:TolB-like protein/DNA-binding winged helix-turn-helix (wHTH) protein
LKAKLLLCARKNRCYTAAPQKVPAALPTEVVKFDEFELDCNRYQLLRAGRRIKLEKLPMELLILLLEKEGHLVTREEIVDRLWGPDVFLDTEHGINTAIRKIRNALRDDPERPRFVQTVTGKGYRFVAPFNLIAQERGNGNYSGTELVPRDTTQTQTDLLVPSSLLQSHHRVRGSVRKAVMVLVAAIGIAAILVGLNVRGLRQRLFAHAGEARIHSLAVLPLENLSGDPAQEYFADGMTDELITRLAQNQALRVISRTSVMQYKKVHRPLADIARELGVDGILEGSVERSGNRIHLNAQLIYAPHERHLWAESYDRDLNDLATLQSELAQTIAREVGFTTTPPSPAARRIRPEAYDAYLLGRYYWFGGKAVKSREYFLKAIQLQPDYAAAHAGLADSYFLEMVDRPLKPESQESFKKGQQALAQALALDASDAHAHNTMAASRFFLGWDVKAGERESARAIELNPRDAEAHYVRCWILFALRRADEALREERLSMEIDPRLHPAALGYALLLARQYDGGIAELRARAEVQPEDRDVHETLSNLYWQKKMYAESVRELAKTYVPKTEAELQDAFRRGGAQAAADWRLAHTKKLQVRMYVSPLDLALAAARGGHKEETLRYLEQACEEHVPWLVFIGSEPDLDFIRSEPRYQAITKKLGLPSAL